MRRFLLSTTLIFFITLSLGHFVSLLYEINIYNQKVRLFNRSIDAPVILVEIDQESLEFYSKELNISWPWPRSLYARAIDYLAAAGARAIAIDMIFSEPSLFDGEDEWLAASMKKAGNVFMPLYFTDNVTTVTDLSRLAMRPAPNISRLPVRQGTKSVPVPAILAALRGGGNVAENPDRDGVYRRLHHFTGMGGSVYPSFSLAMALFASPKLDICRIPFAADGGLNLKFYSRGSFQRYSISALIQSQVRLGEGQAPIVPAATFKDKIVLIGATATSLLDNRPSPLDAAGSGFELHATAMVNLLQKDFLRVLDIRLQWLLVLLAVALLNFFLSRIRMLSWQLAAALGVIVLVLAGNLLLFSRGIDIHFIPWFVGWVACSGTNAYIIYQRIRREKKFIENAFKGYMSDSLLAEIMKNPRGLNLGGEKKRVTIFFSDLAGFTTISEKLPPEGVVGILNTYLERMTTVIMESNGFVNKFEGDAIMAFWGAPLACPDQAARAMRAALRCQEELGRLNDDFAKNGLPRLGMRIGINSGEVIVGNIGSRQRFEYTVIGDSVNLASRLEGINKQYQTAIICGSLSARLAAAEIVLRRLDRVRVKGKQNPEEIFEVVAGRVSDGMRESLEYFEKGLQLYFSGDFARALDIFMARPDDAPAQVFAKRCLVLLESPPAAWDGVWTFTEK